MDDVTDPKLNGKAQAPLREEPELDSNSLDWNVLVSFTKREEEAIRKLSKNLGLSIRGFIRFAVQLATRYPEALTSFSPQPSLSLKEIESSIRKAVSEELAKLRENSGETTQRNTGTIDTPAYKRIIDILLDVKNAEEVVRRKTVPLLQDFINDIDSSLATAAQRVDPTTSLTLLHKALLALPEGVVHWNPTTDSLKWDKETLKSIHK